MRAEDKERALVEVVGRVVAGASGADGKGLEQALGDTIWHEARRFEKERPSRGRERALRLWDERRRLLLKASTEGRRALLEEVATEFAREVLGNFSERMYQLTTRLVPVGLAGLLNAMSPQRLLRGDGLPSIQERVIVDGEVDAARELKDRGTLVVCPTHLSNLDSIVLGWGFYEHGFPPLLYGAGINLFTNRLTSFFMHNLGAYKVDRRKTAPLYKEVLKEYCTVSLELGYHNLFFPGGTRSRSGAVEDKLKLGLLGCGVRAYVNNLRAGRPKPNVYVVPVALSYELVLEAETLVDDHLREAGQSRYMIADDEFSRPTRIFSFLERILELDARIYLTLLPPLDVFGNRVTREGVSLDGRGRPIDTTRYVVDERGTPRTVRGRDEEYTRELGASLADAFHRGNTIMASHLLAWVIFEELRRRNVGFDLYRFLRGALVEDSLSFGEAARACERLRDRLDAWRAEGRIRLDDRLRGRTGDELVLAGLKVLGIYHRRPSVERRGDRLFPVDRNVLYYYRNRLSGYGLEALGEPGHASLAPGHASLASDAAPPAEPAAKAAGVNGAAASAAKTAAQEERT